MAIEGKTLERLKHLVALYRRGYHSDVVDRSVDKLIALERAAAQRELADLEVRLQAFEVRYEMASEDFYRRFRAGELGDSADMVEWSVFYEMWESVRESLQMLESASH